MAYRLNRVQRAVLFAGTAIVLLIGAFAPRVEISGGNVYVANPGNRLADVIDWRSATVRISVVLLATGMAIVALSRAPEDRSPQDSDL